MYIKVCSNGINTSINRFHWTHFVRGEMKRIINKDFGVSSLVGDQVSSFFRHKRILKVWTQLYSGILFYICNSAHRLVSPLLLLWLLQCIAFSSHGSSSMLLPVLPSSVQDGGGGPPALHPLAAHPRFINQVHTAAERGSFPYNPSALQSILALQSMLSGICKSKIYKQENI